jgi:hypothetical protein
MKLLTAALIVLATGIAHACTVFFVFDGKLALAGDGEDWIDPNTQVWFVPHTEKNFGIVYFGFGTGEYPKNGIRLAQPKKKIDNLFEMDPTDAYGFPQAGVNEYGLFFGGAATDFVKDPNPNKKPPLFAFMLDRILRTCKTVKDAMPLIVKYDFAMAQGQILLADRSGDSVVIEAGNVILRRAGDHQVITNFRKSCTPDDAVTCQRYKFVDALFTKNHAFTVDLARQALQGVSFKPVPDSLRLKQSGTQYSVVYDLTNLKLHVYQHADFDHSVVLDVKKELAHPERAVKIGDLFALHSASVKG